MTDLQFKMNNDSALDGSLNSYYQYGDELYSMPSHHPTYFLK